MYKYFKYQNIPNKCAKCVIIDFRSDSETINSLNELGIDMIPTIPVQNIQNAVCGHADMMLHHIGENRFIAAPEAYAYYKSVLPDAEVIQGSKQLSPDYPNDIPYNCAVFGDYVICSIAYTASELLEEYKNKTIINVKQGYAKCSTCIVSESAIITADKGIAAECRKHGIDVLKIVPGYIDLPGMNYGFIGGSTGLISNDVLAVNGELKTHPDGESIRDFCKSHGVNVYELKKGLIKDIGSIMAVF